jgi:type I restriction enzyme, S subunit
LVLRKKEKQNIKYYYYQYFSLYQRQIFNSLGAGVRQTLSARELLEQKIMVPPKPEQDKIVQFLDWKISEMNHCIHQKKKQIKLLEELKRNIIDDLITNGKNSEKRVKISKAKWMGNVPYDWNEYRLKNLFQEINVRSELGLEPHLSMSQKKGLVTDDEDIERRLLSESYAGAKLCEKDDLVLNRLKAHLGVFALVPMKGIVSPDYTVLRINAKRVIPKYLEYLLKSNACRRELVTRVRGIVEGFWRLYTEDLGEIPVCIPNTEEQKAILEVILEKTNNIDEMISGINKEIILVEELRTKLISDVVTGQVDVRNVKIPAYETETDIIDSEEDSDEENQEESTE